MARGIHHELRTELLRQHPALFTPEGRARVKARHAPGVEILCSGGASVAAEPAGAQSTDPVPFTEQLDLVYRTIDGQDLHLDAFVPSAESTARLM